MTTSDGLGPEHPADAELARAESARGEKAQAETSGQIRGSGVLLAGRFLAVGANLLTQILIVRYLSRPEYGAFAYALSIVSLVGGLLALGFDRAISRFLPIFEERGEHARFFGTLFFVLGVIVGLGSAATILFIGLQGWLVGRIVDDPLAIALLAIMIVLAPLEAIDGVLTNLFAVFRATKVIFIRKFILNPGSRLLVVAILVVTAQEVNFLAIGYVVSGVAGLLLYVTLVPGMLRRVGLLGHLRARQFKVPLREIASYTLPLLTMDLLIVSMGAVDAILLGALHGTEEVAELRVVESAARTNSLVFGTFAILFTPLAARFFARNDRSAMRDLYWRTAAWMAVLSFPIFALTFSLAEPVTVLLFEERYRSSGIILALLALGRYIDAAFGANGQTIRIFGGIKETVLVNLVTIAIHITLALILIPPFGALGAALAVLITYVFYNVLKQAILQRVTGIPAFERAYAPVYAAIIVAAGVLALLEVAINPPFVVGLALAGTASLAVLMFGRRQLRIAEAFPELLRFPGSRWFK
ncbi:flippase [soil metagenome]